MALSCNRWLLGLRLPVEYFTNRLRGILWSILVMLTEVNKLSAKSICQPCFYSMFIKFRALLNLFFLTKIFYYTPFIIFLLILAVQPANYGTSCFAGCRPAKHASLRRPRPQRTRQRLVPLVQ